MKSQSNKNGNLLKWVLFFFVIFVFVFGLLIWKAYVEEEKAETQVALFTQYQLTAEEVNVVCEYYGLRLVPTGSAEFDISAWPDFKYCKLVPTGETASCIKAFNESCIDQKVFRWVYEMALYYGLNSDNYMTEEWVLSHPKEAAFLYTGGPLEDGRIVYW